MSDTALPAIPPNKAASSASPEDLLSPQVSAMPMQGKLLQYALARAGPAALCSLGGCRLSLGRGIQLQAHSAWLGLFRQGRDKSLYCKPRNEDQAACNANLLLRSQIKCCCRQRFLWPECQPHHLAQSEQSARKPWTPHTKCKAYISRDIQIFSTSTQIQ